MTRVQGILPTPPTLKLIASGRPEAHRNDQMQERIQFETTPDDESKSPAMPEITDSAAAPHSVHLIYDAEAHLYVIEVRDSDSGDILRTLPPESHVRMRQKTQELIGRLVDRKS
jgi:uncharacterized FlaG/YvyC family protein